MINLKNIPHFLKKFYSIYKNNNVCIYIWNVQWRSMEGLRACVHVYEGHIACITVDLAINTHCPERYRNNWLTCYFLFDFAAFMYSIYPFVIMSSQLPGPYSTMFTTKVIILSLIYRSPVFTPVFFFFDIRKSWNAFSKKDNDSSNRVQSYSV